MKLRIIISLVSFFFIYQFPVFATNGLVINEFLPYPSDKQEWVEFYNGGESSVDLSDYFFDDDTNFDSDSGSSKKLALSGILPPGTTCYWELSSYLNNDGDTPTLFKKDGSIMDSYHYTKTKTDKSYSRINDGGEWQEDQLPTKSNNRCLDFAPTLTPSPIPIFTPTSVPTSKPTSKTNPTSTIKPQATPISTKEILPTVTKIQTKTFVTSSPNDSKPSSSVEDQKTEVLGEEVIQPTEFIEKKEISSPLLLILIFGGTVCMGGAVWSSIQRIRKRRTLFKL